MRAYASVLNQRPWALDEMMLAVDYYTDSPKEVVLVLPDGVARESEVVAPMLQVMRTNFVPNHVFVIAGGKPSRGLAKLVPWARNKPAKGHQPTVYVCERGACDLPTSDPRVFTKQITKVVPYPKVNDE